MTRTKAISRQVRRILCAVLAVTFSLLTAVSCAGGDSPNGTSGKQRYPLVFVHGLGGFGEDSVQTADLGIQYWSVTSGPFLSRLRADYGYELYAPSINSNASAWDCACELYAKLMGVTVDYGKAHSKTHNHAQFGAEYTEPYLPAWSSERKIHLIGHSFGGVTIQLFTELMANGSAAERAASGKAVSPLFKGGKADWIQSVTTLCSPNNGSSAMELLDLAEIVGLGARAFTNTFTGSLLLKGIEALNIKYMGLNIAEVIKAAATEDTAFYDCRIANSAARNASLHTQSNIYYFAYAFDATTQSILENKRILTDAAKLPGLDLLAALIGSYEGTEVETVAGTITVDEKWQANDGLVNAISALAPFNAKQTDWPTEDITTAQFASLTPGRWYNMPIQSGDHPTPCGMFVNNDYMDAFWLPFLAGLDQLAVNS
ncbi:MAG: hypothetical protein LBR73_03930 [Oscillospiraceae bacterium]|nr:hypothetical protein [Oscillospiraceae bacterium]